MFREEEYGKMAKYAILSDIHSNMEALGVVLAACKEFEVDHYLSLGDIVGYGAQPAECMEMTRALPLMAAVKGNHDEYASRYDDELAGFNPHAKEAIVWTRGQISKEAQGWLRELPLRQTVPGTGMTLVHATLDSPDTWGYVFDAHHAVDNFSYQFTQLCFCGHSHVPVAFAKKPISSMSENTIDVLNEWAPHYSAREIDNGCFFEAEMFPVEIKPGFKYLFNIGSIGQPRNRDPRASFAIYDNAARMVTRYCIPYDIVTTQRKILAAGLPERLANRLSLGC